MIGVGTMGAAMLPALAACGGGTSTSSAPTTAGPGVAPYDPTTPYWLQGNFAPVFDEVHLDDLRVDGTLPVELNGLYVRNGSNPATGRSPHWFLGDGMVHGIRIEMKNMV